VRGDFAPRPDLNCGSGEPVVIWGTVGYLAAMEALQTIGYGVNDQCANSANQALTGFAYLHVAYQPLVINASGMAIARQAMSARMRRNVLRVPAVATVLAMLRAVPFQWAGPGRPGDVMCGVRPCTVSGEWHLGWSAPLNDI